MTLREQIKSTKAFEALNFEAYDLDDGCDEILSLIQSEIEKAIPEEKRGSGDAMEHMIEFGVVMGNNEAISELRTNLQKSGLLKEKV